MTLQGDEEGAVIGAAAGFSMVRVSRRARQAGERVIPLPASLSQRFGFCGQAAILHALHNSHPKERTHVRNRRRRR